MYTSVVMMDIFGLSSSMGLRVVVILPILHHISTLSTCEMLMYVVIPRVFATTFGLYFLVYHIIK